MIVPAFSYGTTEVMESGRISYSATNLEDAIMFIADPIKNTIGMIIVEDAIDSYSSGNIVSLFIGDTATVLIGKETLDVEWYEEVWFANCGAYIGDLDKFFKILRTSSEFTIGGVNKHLSMTLDEKDSFVLALLDNM